MRLLFATSELHPYSKTGGLADATAALAKWLARAGHDVSVVSPLYHGIRGKHPDLRYFDWRLDVPLGDAWVHGEVWLREAAPNLRHFFVRHDGFYDRPSLYNDRGRDYADNAERFLFLSKAAVHLSRYLPEPPQIVHAHDWQTGFVPLLIKHQRDREGWSAAPATCHTIHNLAYQGVFGGEKYALANLPRDYFHSEGAEFYGLVNFLKTGLAFADRLTTVSPRYAREITTEEFGCSLDGLLRRRQRDLTGILNGVDYEEWSPTGNPHLRHEFTAGELSGKALNKADLQREVGLPLNPSRPVFSNITRLTTQKGVDIQLAALEEMLAADLQFVLLGSGDPHYEHGYRRLESRYPEKVAVRIGFDVGLAHRIEAGSDFFLMPSQFEPCGLNQLYSQRYGTIPIVRRTGGLDDSVVDIADDPEAATGIKFTNYNARALAKAIRKALVLYETPRLFDAIRQRGMKADFSWASTARRYVEFYQQVLNP